MKSEKLKNSRIISAVEWYLKNVCKMSAAEINEFFSGNWKEKTLPAPEH